jgi:hypothetical protein
MRMLREREERIMKTIYGEFSAGKTDFLARIAEFATVRSQVLELTSALKLNEQQGEE